MNAAIAQSVERILGKDEVASSNLASSSIFPTIYIRFEPLDVTVRWTVTRDGSTERNNNPAKQDANKSG